MSSLRNLDLNLLTVFDALLTECHVTRAAEKVHLSQSATSHALNRLREQLDDPILVRTDRGMQPTPRALAMLPAVRQALKLVERTVAPPETFVPAHSDRTFVIASTDYFEAVVLPDLVAHFEQVAPGVRIEIELISDRLSERRLESHAVDLVVGLDAIEEVPSHLIKQHWIRESQVCVVGADNTRVGEQLSLDQYVELPHVVFADLIGGVTSGVDRWLETQDRQRRYISRNLSYIAAARIVAKTDAVITLPLQMARLFSQMLPVRIVTPPPGMPALEMTLISHPFFAKHPSTCWLKEQVMALGSGSTQ